MNSCYVFPINIYFRIGYLMCQSAHFYHNAYTNVSKTTFTKMTPFELAGYSIVKLSHVINTQCDNIMYPYVYTCCVVMHWANGDR